MQFSEEINPANNIIRAYSANRVQVNETWFEHSIIITPNAIIDPWSPRNISELTKEHWQIIIDLKPQIIVFGSGNYLQFPPAALLQPLYEQQIGIEIMDTIAACRTYNILMTEGREAIAALII